MSRFLFQTEGWQMIFNTQRFSTHDGDGIRTIVFTKGCSLSCPWCQNPESRSAKPELLYDERLCIQGCDECGQRSQGALRWLDDGLVIHREMLDQTQVESLRDVCPAKALTVCGEQRSIEQVMAEVRADKPYYDKTGGGLTISGGEPFMQPEYTAELAAAAKAEGINTAVETCLHTPWSYIEPSLEHIDCFLADLKHTDARKFAEWAKGSVSQILKNFRALSDAGKRLIVRVPVVPDFNDTPDELEAIIDFAASLENVDEIHFIPYHTLGMGKYKLLDMPYKCSQQSLNNPELLAFAEQTAKDRGLTVKLRG